MLQARGYVSRNARLQMHASREAGGLDHRHAYQHAAAALVDEVEKAMDAPEGTPARAAVDSLVRATCLRLGWTEREDVREWWPVHLQGTLHEDSV